jgi:hypothetical protein
MVEALKLKCHFSATTTITTSATTSFQKNVFQFFPILSLMCWQYIFHFSSFQIFLEPTTTATTTTTNKETQKVIFAF